MQGESMNDEQKQELLELFRNTPYLTFNEVMSLLTGSFPGKKVRFAEKEWVRERYELIKRALEHDIGKFALKVYFYERYYPGGVMPLLEPECATKYDELQYYVQQEEHAACFWLFGKLSAKEIKDWLQNKCIASSFFDTTANPVQNSPDDKLQKHSDTPAAAVSETPPQRQKPPKPEVTQKDAAKRLGVDERTIRNWESGKTPLPHGYTRQSLTGFLLFANDFNMKNAFKEDTNAKNNATPGGDMSEYSEGVDW